MTNKDFFLALDALEQEKGISKEYFIEALQTALASAYKRNFDEVRPVMVELKPERSSIDIYAYRTIVSEVVDETCEIALQDAKLIKKSVPEYLLGEWRLANNLASMPILDAGVECLIEKGVLTPPEDGIGAEGCWMSVEK